MISGARHRRTGLGVGRKARISFVNGLKAVAESVVGFLVLSEEPRRRSPGSLCNFQFERRDRESRSIADSADLTEDFHLG